MRRRLPLLTGASLVLVVIAGCTRGHVNDAAAYCDELRLNEPLLEADITNELDIAPRVSLYAQLRDAAPLDVEEEWQTIIDLVDAATKVDLTDQAAVVAIQDKAFASADAAQAIVDQARQVCGIELPAVGQLAPPAVTISVPPSTVPETTPPAT